MRGGFEGSKPAFANDAEAHLEGGSSGMRLLKAENGRTPKVRLDRKRPEFDRI